MEQTKRGVTHSARIEALEKGQAQVNMRLDAVEATAANVEHNTQEILTIMKGGKTIVVYAKRYGWRVASAGLGYAIAMGWINEAFANMAKNIFGI